MKAVITVIGKDRPGIIYQVSKILFETGINIEDISQTIMQDYFTMIMLVKGPDNTDITALSEKMNILDEDGVSVSIQKSDIFDVMHKI